MKINIMAEKFGYVTQVIGPVVDVIFENGGEDLPPIYEALRIERDNGEKLIIEVEQHTHRSYPSQHNGQYLLRYAVQPR